MVIFHLTSGERPPPVMPGPISDMVWPAGEVRVILTFSILPCSNSMKMAQSDWSEERSSCARPSTSKSMTLVVVIVAGKMLTAPSTAHWAERRRFHMVSNKIADNILRLGVLII